jgi:hypothetical protein
MAGKAKKKPKKKAVRFAEVVEKGGWYYDDLLNGKKLKDGEPLDLKFPSGEIIKSVPVEERKYTDPVMEQGGGTWDTPVKQAWVTLEIHGANIRFRLVGTGIKARRAERIVL